MAKVLKIDHIAVLVDDMQSSLSFWQDALGIQLAGLDEVPAEQARVAFFPTGASEIELVQPTTTDSGLARYLEKRGPGMHHICLQVDDIAGMLARLKERGVQLINETPRQGAGGKQYAFIHPKSANGVMVELYQLPPEPAGNDSNS